ncbi:hypothetical protein F5972_14965 [Microbispora cellulosiformans]|uniref:Tetratricopeptide repeat protein n=1 Tax=Microbispora cellulosiformans TaxID=2614688 RepID=A0A5J5K209_9ACTN|nr:hypothetical protein [Microbispora cellulosiformans]KAA9378193.1 hypothetical protein F5972_14965 [Microbispora cellulosiformans]
MTRRERSDAELDAILAAFNQAVDDLVDEAVDIDSGWEAIVGGRPASAGPAAPPRATRDRAPNGASVPEPRSEVRERGVSGAPAAAVSPPDTGLSPVAGARLVQRRTAGRAADDIVERAGTPMIPGGDLRTMRDAERGATRASIADWRELLSRCPAGVLGPEGSARVAETVAVLATSLIADRDERGALRLVQAALPHLVFLGRWHPAVLEVRRAWAESLSELGRHRQAETGLRRLGEDEQRMFGHPDPRTTLLLLWTLVGQGRLREAEDGFGALQDRVLLSQGPDSPMLRHVQCRRAWLLGRQGRVEESVSGYDAVIVNRIHELDEDHADSLDARHSKGKLLVVAGHADQAQALLRALAEDRARVQGDRHPDTLETRKYLALAQALADPRDDRVVRRVVHDLEESLRLQDKRHGPGHPMSRDTAAWLGLLLRLQEAVRFREPLPVPRQLPAVEATGGGACADVPAVVAR